MAVLPPKFYTRFDVTNGDGLTVPAAGYYLYTYESGTTTNKATYTNQAGSVSNTNPIILDATGSCLLWLMTTGEYTFVLKTAGGSTIWTRDDVGGIPAADVGSYLPLAGGTMTGAITLAGNAASALQAVPKQQLDAQITALSASLTSSLGAAVPIGTVAMWLTATVPSGWLHMNGQAVSRTTYATLFALWGTTFGSGDGSTTFNIPEVRGYFPRFWDAARGIDSGRAIASYQSDQNKAHTHTPLYVGGSNRDNGDAGEFVITADGEGNGQQTNSTGVTGSSGGTEVRPINYSFMGICKAL